MAAHLKDETDLIGLNGILYYSLAKHIKSQYEVFFPSTQQKDLFVFPKLNTMGIHVRTVQDWEYIWPVGDKPMLELFVNFC